MSWVEKNIKINNQGGTIIRDSRVIKIPIEIIAHHQRNAYSKEKQRVAIFHRKKKLTQ